MRILHLETGRHVYGGALQVLLLVEGLQAQGIDNLLAVPTGSDVAAQARERDLPVHTLSLAGEADLLFPLRFRRLIRSVDPDLVHLHSRRGADTLGSLGATGSGVPTVLTRRVDNPEPSWTVPLKYRLFDRVIAISQAIRDVLVHQGVDPSRIRCVHSALDSTAFDVPCPREDFLRTFPIDPGDPVVAMAAQFIPRKGHETLLEAIPGILRNHPRTRFLLFGRGPLHAAVSRKVAEAGLAEVVHLPGFHRDLSRFLPCFDLLVHPATAEGLGIILLQAAAAGLPVVASRAGGIPEAVAHGETGLLVPPSDPGALASAACELLRDPARARSMGEAGRARVERDFSVRQMVEGNLAVYRELLDASPPSP